VRNYSCDAPEPDCWWGPDGIDAMCWADGIPYEYVAVGE
jgi:hypothetical protein